MPAPWQTWKKTLSCKADLDQVHEPSKALPSPSKERDKERQRERQRHTTTARAHATTTNHNNSNHYSSPCTTSSTSTTSSSKARRRKADAAGRGGDREVRRSPGAHHLATSSTSLKDIIYGSSRGMHKHSSPDSVTSDYFMADEVMRGGLLGAGGISYYCGTPLSSSYIYRGGSNNITTAATTPLRRFSTCYDCNTGLMAGGGGYDALDSPLHGTAAWDSPKLGCHKCGRLFNKLEALEQHQIVHHAVTELNPGDSSRNVVEIIFRTSWLKKEVACGRIDRILKVHNTQRTINRFEEYRDGVKARAAKLSKKHPRCLADGNELLRFYGTTLACSLGFNASSSLCTLATCNVCHVIRSGFSASAPASAPGIHTTSTSGSAHDCIPWPEDDELFKSKRAMVLCRVIAGRVHMDEAGDKAVSAPPGFDSLSADPAPYSNMHHLLVFNSTALLPCFVVIYRV